MNLICNSRGIFGRLRPGARMQDMMNAGFEYSVYNASVFCGLKEFEDLKRNNFKREEDVYLTEQPEKLNEEMEKLILSHARERELKLPIALAPYVASDIKADTVDNDVLIKLAEEMLKAAVAAGCERIIVHPLTIGIEVNNEWDVNREFYMGLAALTDSLDSDIRILLINKGKDINGHMVRGVCAEPEEAVKWVDTLNELAGKKRFGFCFDIGTATICGQNLYTAMVPLGERLEAVIVRDCDGIHDVSMLTYTACEQGQQTNWLYMIRALRKIDFDGDLIMDFADTYGSFLYLLRPSLLALAHETGEFLAWQINMERMVKSYDKRVLFGAGNMCRSYMKDYGKDYPPLFTCDNNSNRWGEEFSGLTIENPEKLKELPEDVTIFICNMYYDEIEDQLRSMGLKNTIERFSDEYMATFHMERLKMAADPNAGKGAKS